MWIHLKQLGMGNPASTSLWGASTLCTLSSLPHTTHFSARLEVSPFRPWLAQGHTASEWWDGDADPDSILVNLFVLLRTDFLTFASRLSCNHPVAPQGNCSPLARAVSCHPCPPHPTGDLRVYRESPGVFPAFLSPGGADFLKYCIFHTSQRKTMMKSPEMLQRKVTAESEFLGAVKCNLQVRYC